MSQPAANPTVLCLLMSDGMHIDSFGKHYILGTFNALHAQAFPATHPFMALFLSITNGHGRATLLIRLVQVANDDHVVFEGQLDLEFQSPLDVIDQALPAPGVTLPEAGEYRWQVVCGGNVLYERKLIVTPIGGTQ